jgi:diguanylate cyclase (GGDEF)-like protein
MNPLLQVLVVGTPDPAWAASPYGSFECHACASLAQAAQRLREAPHDALLVHIDGAIDAVAAWPALSHAVLDAAVVVVADPADAGAVLKLIARGVQDVLPDTDPAALARALRLGVERKRIERVARKAYATDLATGLPNHAQLLEHMNHLLALREREPAPMALLVLRIEGLATTAATLGTEAANVLRRKAAVRIRAGLRASDVVAAIGSDAFAVLLAWIDAPDDGARVAAKMVNALQQPFGVAGRECVLAVSCGLAQYPLHGRLADELLRHALGQASLGGAVGRAGFANFVERGQAGAANDDS